MLFVVPGDDRRLLHELLRCSAYRRPELLERIDQLDVRRDEAGPVSGHRRPLAERVENRDVSTGSNLERGARGLVEPQLRVRLVAREQELVLTREISELPEEVERRNG